MQLIDVFTCYPTNLREENRNMSWNLLKTFREMGPDECQAAGCYSLEQSHYIHAFILILIIFCYRAHKDHKDHRDYKDLREKG